MYPLFTIMENTSFIMHLSVVIGQNIRIKITLCFYTFNYLYIGTNFIFVKQIHREIFKQEAQEVLQTDRMH
jgi:hypothetical protein